MEREKLFNLKCYLVGHDHTSMTNDGGYGICDRCGMHDYYHNDETIQVWPRKDHYPFWSPGWRWIKYKVIERINGKIRAWKRRLLDEPKWTDGDLPF